MDGVDFINRLDDDALHLVFDHFHYPKEFLPFGQSESFISLHILNFNHFCSSACKRWNGLLSLFCLQLTSLTVYDHELSYPEKREQIDEIRLLRMATNTPNVRSLRINGPVKRMTPEGADRLAQLWSRVEELDLEGSRFEKEILTNFLQNFPLLKKLRFEPSRFTTVQHFDAICSNQHPNLVDLEFNFWNSADRNWFESCHLPLKRFAVNILLHENATLSTLENCCKDSLQTIKVGLGIDNNSQAIGRILSTFHRLTDVAFDILDYTVLENQPILPHLEKFCVSQIYDGPSESLIGFLKSYPQLKELNLKRGIFDDYLAENIATTLPNLRSLSFVKFTGTSLMNLTSLRLEYFNPGYDIRWSADDVRAFVREMPSLQRLTVWNVDDDSDADCSFLFKALRDDIRASGSNRQLWISRDDINYLLLDSSDQCTDTTIEKFIKVNKKPLIRILYC